MPETARKGDEHDTVARDVGVLTVDDQAVFRRIARAVIAATPGFNFVGQASSGEEAIDAVERVHPDLALIDVRMPGIGGMEAARRIAAAHPDTVVVLISIDGPDTVTREASLCGAAELVRKQDFGPALLRRLWDAHGTGV
jgi:two-component system, NarL family, invasion response regulator UvrY